MKQMDIVLVGVGGQGTLLASRILGALAMDLNYDVKVSEVHGMAQRGGSVVTYVRIGDKVNSPLVEAGSADYVLAFEQLEAARAMEYLKKGGCVIVNSQKSSPMPVVTGATAYPEGLLERLSEACDVVALDAYGLAEQAGEARAVNLVLLGVLCARMDSDKAAWLRAIEACVPARFVEVNKKAFELGYQTQQKQ